MSEHLDEIRSRMIKKKVHFKYLNDNKGYWEETYTFIKQDAQYLFDQVLRADKNAQDLDDMDRQLFATQLQNQRFKSELENALYFVKYSRHEPDKALIMQESIERTLKGVEQNENKS